MEHMVTWRTVTVKMIFELVLVILINVPDLPGELSYNGCHVHDERAWHEGGVHKDVKEAVSENSVYLLKHGIYVAAEVNTSGINRW